MHCKYMETNVYNFNLGICLFTVLVLQSFLLTVLLPYGSFIINEFLLASKMLEVYECSNKTNLLLMKQSDPFLSTMASALNHIAFEKDICVFQSEATECSYFLLNMRYAVSISPLNALTLIVLDYWRVEGTDNLTNRRWLVHCSHQEPSSIVLKHVQSTDTTS